MTINGTQRRKTKANVPEERRKILHESENLWISHSGYFQLMLTLYKVLNYFSLDPRIKRIKQEEKAAREAKKKGKTGAPNGLSKKQQEEEDKKRKEEEAKAQEEAEKVC